MCLIEAIVFNILQIFFQSAWKNVHKQLTLCCVGCLLLSVLLCSWMNKKRFPLFCKDHKTLSHLQLNLKQGCNVAEVGCESWGISLGWNSWLSPSFSWGKFSHLLSFEQLCLIKNIWWIITEQNNVHIFFNMYLSGLLKVFLDYHYKCCRHFVCARANKINNSLEVWTWYVLSI